LNYDSSDKMMGYDFFTGWITVLITLRFAGSLYLS